MGRRRKVSTSTVATVDNSRFSWVKESAILKPAPKGNEDNGPTCVLTDAIVYDKDGKTMGNPLFVGEVGPMVVRGKLEIGNDADVLQSLIKSNTRSTYIEVSDSFRYAIGYGEDMRPACWVSGKAGWYEIRPAPAYEAMYLEICEATMLYYEALGVYEDHQKQCGRGKQKSKPTHRAAPTLEYIFFRYAVAAGNGLTLNEVRESYLKWAPFLASHFTKETEFVWEGTAFAKWIQDQAANAPKDGTLRSIPPKPFPRFRRAAQILEVSEYSSDATSERSRTKPSKRGSSQDAEMSDAPTSQFNDLAIRNGKPWVESPVPLPPQYQHLTKSLTHIASPSTASPSIASPSTHPSSVTPAPAVSSSPVDLLAEVFREISKDVFRPNVIVKPGFDVQQVTINHQLWKRCSLSMYKAVPEVLAYYSKDLLPHLGPEWKGTTFYRWLEMTSQEPLRFQFLTPDKLPPKIARRGGRKGPVSQGTSASKTLSSSRPASDDPRRSRAPASQQRLGDNSEEEPWHLRRGRKSGKNAGLRPRSSKKRPASEMDLDDRPVPGWRGRKSAKTSHVVSEEDDDMTDASRDESSSHTEEEEGDHMLFPIPPPDGSIKLVVHAERIPPMSPTGPNGTWACEEEGCTYVVRAAEDQEGQGLIQAHFHSHKAQVERLNLAKQESRGHLPINHLLDKIKALGKRAIDKKTVMLNDDLVPAPVKRRLLV